MLTHFEMSPVDILNEVSVGRQAGNDDSLRDAKRLKGRKLAEPQHKDLLGWCVSVCVCVGGGGLQLTCSLIMRADLGLNRALSLIVAPPAG